MRWREDINQMHPLMKGVILLFVLLIAALVAMPTALVDGIQTPEGLVRSDMRAMAVAIESYYVEYNSYPAWSADPSENLFGARRSVSHVKVAPLPTFMNPGKGRAIATLTTPTAYLPSYPKDRFGVARDQPLCYWAPGAGGWIMWSAGPDGVYNVTMDNVAQAYDPAGRNPIPYLLDLTYDPTNGMASRGEIYRTKE